MLFRQFREALAECAELKAEVSRLTADAASAERAAEEAERRIEDLKRVVDSYSYQSTRRYVFAKTEAPVAQAVEMPNPRRKMARAVIQEKTLKAFAAQQKDLQQAFAAEANIDESTISAA